MPADRQAFAELPARLARRACPLSVRPARKETLARPVLMARMERQDQSVLLARKGCRLLGRLVHKDLPEPPVRPGRLVQLVALVPQDRKDQRVLAATAQQARQAHR